ncbi:FIST N-terminal domain-containing protein [Anaerosporobacter sp.]
MEYICVSGHIDNMINEAVKKLDKCSFIMYSADDRRFKEISERLYEALPDCKMIGTTGIMLTHNASMAEGISAIGFSEDEVEVYVGALREASTCPVKYLPDLTQKVHMIDKKYQDSICINFSTNNEEKIVSTMKISLDGSKVRLLGGTAGNTRDGEAKKVACNG